MNKTFKKAMSITLSVIMATSSIGACAGSAYAAEKVDLPDNTSYLVQIDDAQKYMKILSKYKDKVSKKSGVSKYLKNKNILNIELSKLQVLLLKADKAVTVEEDITLNGSGEKAESLYDEVTKPIEQWNLDLIGADIPVAESENHVKVGIIDTGVCASSKIPIAGRINLVPGEEDVNPLYEDVSGHGTSIAGIIGAIDDGRSIKGVNTKAQLYSVKALNDGESAPLSRIIEGIYWCIDNGMNIINMSFGTSTDSPLLHQAILDAEKAGILMIASAGNDASAGVQYPAAYDEVIAVGSIDNNGVASDFSAVGEEVELVAPGENIAATGFFDEVVCTQGTSVATAHVTGLASLLWDKDATKSADFIRALLNDSARKLGAGNKYGSGVIDADFALKNYDKFAKNYDKFAKNYKETSAVKNTQILNNTDAVDTYTDTEVKALWSGTNHMNAIKDSYSNDKKVLLKYAVKMPDDDFKNMVAKTRPCTIEIATSDCHYFHGYGPYMANTIYLARYARVYNQGMALISNPTDPNWSNIYPVNVAGGYKTALDPIVRCLVDLNNPSTARGWDYLYIKMNRDEGLGDKFTTPMTQSRGHNALLLIGIAVHCAMDAFAHCAYKTSKGDTHIKVDNDSPNNYKERYNTAKEVALNILNKWDSGEDFQVSDFCVAKTIYPVGAFYMHNFYHFAVDINPAVETIVAKRDYFAQRDHGSTEL